jgi:opacity protein-like surface antigen
VNRHCGFQRSAAGILVLLATVLAALSWVTPVQAAAGQWQAGARLGTAWLSDGGLGPALDGYLRRGIAESLDLDLQVLSSIHPFQADSKSADAPSNVSAARVKTPWALGVVPGLLYRWDVFRVVPYAGIGLGFYSVNTAVVTSAGGQFGASGRAGLDYLLNRSVVLSVQASVHVMNRQSSLQVPWVQIGLGAAHAWGW